MKDSLHIIGTSGTNGSGKDTVGQMLAERHGYLFVSVSEFLREEARRRDLPVIREVLRTISTEWRRDYGLGVLVDRAVELYKSQADEYRGVVISPMRNVGEARHLKDLGGTLIWVDAKPRIRYERIRSSNRGRAGEDDKTFAEFVAEEAAEMHAPAEGDDASLSMAALKELADVVLHNDGSDVEVFKTKAEKALGFL